MRLSRPTKTLALVASLTMLAGAAAGCGSSDDSADSAPVESDEGGAETTDGDGEAPDTAAEQSGVEYSSDDLGTGAVTYDGTRDAGYQGSCEISRENGKQDVGDIAAPGLKAIVAIDNSAVEGATRQGNFTILLDTTAFSTTTEEDARNGTPPINGSITDIAYGSGLTPYGKTQAIALVTFTGETEDGVPVVAEVVCEIQNKF